MISRLLVIALLCVSLTACSSTDDEGEMAPLVLGERQGGVAQGNLDGDEQYGAGTVPAVQGANTNIAGGTQQDLATNIGDKVFFGYDSYDLSPEARVTLDRQAQWLGQYPSLSVSTEGHSDERGTREYNLALGERRANAVKNYLTSLGVDPRRINAISYGKERPEVLGADSTSWAQNRRGVTVVR